MDLSSENLVEALVACSGGPADEPAEVVALVRQAQPAFAATLFSAWEAEGIELSPALRADVDSARARYEFYRSVAASLIGSLPALTTIKGLEVAALYPEGLVRYQSDLDFIATAEADLWQAVRLLAGTGWEVDTATFSRLGKQTSEVRTALHGALQVMVSLRRPHEDRFQLPYGLELATYYTAGNQGGIPPIFRLPDEWLVPAIKNLIMLLHERYEQPFRARDLLDSSLLHAALGSDEIGTLHKAVIALGLGLEYAELVRLVGRTGLAPLTALPAGQWTAARVRAGRLARGASSFARPLAGTGRQLQRRVIQGSTSRAEAAVWEMFQRQLEVTTSVGAGLLAFGLPISGPRSDVTAAVLRRKGKLAWADTPAGRFLLTLGDYVSQSAIDELTQDDAQAPAAETSR